MDKWLCHLHIRSFHHFLVGLIDAQRQLPKRFNITATHQTVFSAIADSPRTQ